MFPAGGAVPAMIEREMSATVAEFVRGLEAAFGNRVEGGPDFFRIVDNGAAMEIDLQIGPPRVIALLRLPTLRVRIRFTAGQPDQHRALLARMDRAMQRGGG
jgi:hypothetical protein